jgi:PAS domain S-box-containing protein
LLFDRLATEAFAAVPLISRDQLVGLLWVDNHFNKKTITGEDMKFLMGFSDQVASAVSAAQLFQKVSLAEAELENIFRSISDMVFFTDREYTIRNVNEAVVERIGLPKSEIIGQKCYKVFHGKDEPWTDCPHHATIDSMEATVKELEDPHMDGTFIASTAPMLDTDGEFQGTVHVVRDITEINRLRKKLQTSERMAALGEVAAKVAHEIRNPLVSVGGFAVRLEKKLDGSLKEYATIIAEEVSRLENILKDILGFVKEVRMSRIVIDFNELVRNTLGLLEKEIQDKGNRIERDLFHEPVMMYIDPDRVKEAILNILMNSNQATENGTISVKTYITDSCGVLEVTDTGHGIRDTDINRIFDPFYTTRATGTGLGLAICKRIVEENDGRINVRSLGAGKGTHFEIYLPLKEARDEDTCGR